MENCINNLTEVGNSEIFNVVLNTAYKVYFTSIVVFIFFNVFADGDYVIKTVLILFCGQFDRKYTLNDTSSIYGIGTFRDCDISLKHVRLARILRQLDFARYHYYERTGICKRSFQHNIRSLQGSTLAVFIDEIPIFWLYKIYSKLVYWDEKSLFIEHKVMTLHDGKVRCLLVSRQHAIDGNGVGRLNLIEKLLEGIEGTNDKPKCPEYIKRWLDGMHSSSKTLKMIS